MNMRIFLLATVLVVSSSNSKQTKPSLNHFKYGAAWVVPLVEINTVDHLFLSREAGGRDKGTYDAFGGSRERKDTSDPSTAAAREFAEEAILSATLGMSIADVRSYIDLKGPNTIHALAIDDKKHGYKNVFYITMLSESDTNTIIKKFPQARLSAKKWDEKEKDEMALIALSDFKKAIKSSSRNSGIQVAAVVTDLQGKVSHKKITLRGILSRNLRKYVEDKPFIQGKNSKVRFYTI